MEWPKNVITYEMSDFHTVQHLARQIGLVVYPSSRIDKKYMIFHDGKRVHFGQKGYEDFTAHHDLRRRANFRKRNARWASAPKFTPAWLSYHLLW
jgi:hypothetical protein